MACPTSKFPEKLSDLLFKTYLATYNYNITWSITIKKSFRFKIKGIPTLVNFREVFLVCNRLENILSMESGLLFKAVMGPVYRSLDSTVIWWMAVSWSIITHLLFLYYLSTIWKCWCSNFCKFLKNLRFTVFFRRNCNRYLCHFWHLHIQILLLINIKIAAVKANLANRNILKIYLNKE